MFKKQLDKLRARLSEWGRAIEAAVDDDWQEELDRDEGELLPLCICGRRPGFPGCRNADLDPVVVCIRCRRPARLQAS